MADILSREELDDACLRDSISIASTDSFVSAAEVTEAPNPPINTSGVLLQCFFCQLFSVKSKKKISLDILLLVARKSIKKIKNTAFKKKLILVQ